ncbi:MAG TPA: thiosulfate oxidation carrier protein SoxY [Methylomirabilota bacterium]|nr:thiosulfate oxidation carrier protein SoxY [Methylomirabilota bacterium]
MTRRALFRVLGMLGLVGTGGAVPLVAPRPAQAQQFGVHESVQDGLKRLFGSRPLQDGARTVTLEVPLIAENGAVVPVSVEVGAPMTAGKWVKHVYFVADKNRIPIIARATLTPEAGQALVGATVRLGETGDVRAIAELSDGTLLQVKREVKVTFSGCGG